MSINLRCFHSISNIYSWPRCICAGDKWSFVSNYQLLSNTWVGTAAGVDAVDLFERVRVVRPHEPEEAEFFGSQDEERVASAVDASGGSADPVDVFLRIERKTSTFTNQVHSEIFCSVQQLRDLGIIWRVVLDDPVHFRNVESSSRHVRAEQDAGVGVAELEECGGSFGLLLFAL
ncbi:hypothetical protein XENOCAPTIV_009665 [Xenoophorus captivus]|uniref:Uncharacterized protein n=1 Tax=Xenoophorus captivus TaxID=1517983 RepID=A0ABV0QS40_9TELE